jgi:hypothetical protein
LVTGRRQRNATPNPLTQIKALYAQLCHGHLCAKRETVMKSTENLVVRPTYDCSYYLQRSEFYGRAADAEPDRAIRAALKAVERECQRRAAELAAQAPPPMDVEWQE